METTPTLATTKTLQGKSLPQTGLPGPFPIPTLAQRRERFDRLAPIYQAYGINLRPPEDDEPSCEVGERFRDQNGQRLDTPVPMSRADALHPWADDWLASSQLHYLLVSRFFGMMQAVYHKAPAFTWSSKTQFDTGIVGCPPIYPDLAFFLGVINQLSLHHEIFYLNREPIESLRCPLAVEISSPATRENDFVDKLVMYSECGFEQYLIVEPDQHGIGFYEYRPGLQSIPSVGPKQDRVLIESLGAWVSAKGQNVVFTNAKTGTIIEDYPEALRKLQEMKKIAAEEDLRLRVKRARQLTKFHQARADAATARAKSMEQEIESLKRLLADNTSQPLNTDIQTS